MVLNMIYVPDPGTEGPHSSQHYLEGTYSEIYPVSAVMRPGLKDFSNIFFSRRDPKSCFTGMSGIYTEGGELGFPQPFIWRRLRHPILSLPVWSGWGSGNRPARDCLAFQ